MPRRGRQVHPHRRTATHRGVVQPEEPAQQDVPHQLHMCQHAHIQLRANQPARRGQHVGTCLPPARNPEPRISVCIAQGQYPDAHSRGTEQAATRILPATGNKKHTGGTGRQHRQRRRAHGRASQTQEMGRLNTPTLRERTGQVAPHESAVARIPDATRIPHHHARPGTKPHATT